MADFLTARSHLASARSARDAAQAAVAAALERQKAIQVAQARRARTAGADDRAAGAERARLAAQAKEAAADVATARAQAARAAAAVAAALDVFAEFTDPRHNVSRLSDGLPFALLPVRLETRFATIGSGDAVKTQLWVRIYPDDCWIDTFEPTLSATELANAQVYWQGMWRAGGIEADQRAAWRSLVAAHGSGRAGYIVDTYQPTNLAAQPAKAETTDEILVIPTQSPPAAPDAAAITAYWQANWLADGDLAKQAAARAALDAAVGAAHAADLIATYPPFNLADAPQPPLRKSDVALSMAFVVFPPDPPTKQAAWSQAPQVRQFPDRFIVLGYSGGSITLNALGGAVALPLYVGPDPSADPNTDPTSAIHPDGGDLFVPDQLKWMVDFPAAVAAGVGLAIDLTAEQARAGFDRLIVLGLQLSAHDGDGKTALEELLRHHAAGRAGLALLPQGTPTHNTTGTGTGYTKRDDPDQTFDDRKNAPLFTPTPDPLKKRDGQWVAELLGVDPAVFTGIHDSGGNDQMLARAMQRALWPATIGYWMDKLLTPVFNDDAVANTWWFFTQFVSGRGAAPAIRIGGQPYGILPTTAFSRIGWLDEGPRLLGRPASELDYLRQLYKVLLAIDADWSTMSQAASYVGKPGDAHQLLLDIVGLHPASVEYYSRYAESLSELFNVANIWGLGPTFYQALLALDLQAAARALLATLGYTGTQQPNIFQHFFLRNADQITSVIDDRPLSETDPIRPYATGGRNYIRWLIDAANTSLNALSSEQGFIGGVTPTALLYLYLRHALMLGYYDTSYNLHKSAGVLSAVELAALKPEPAFVHVAESAPASESRFSALYKTESRITGDPTLLVSDYITHNLASLAQSAELKDQLDALAVLADAPTAQLERAFAEHIDLCTYRFDAWLLGLVNYQLQALRYGKGGNGKTPKTGVYLGAYAWLEDLRPRATLPPPIRLPIDLDAVFPGSPPILRDPTNGGYIHAPSLTHARTAAVLRSGYLANATPANPQVMAINLSSDRVRQALSLLEGIRNGQSLGALLGYRFERGLHDDHGLAEVDKFIYPMRKAFPLVADSLLPTQTPPDVPIEAIEARNVMDGRKLIAQIRASGVSSYPFGLTTLPAANAAEATALNSESNRLLDVYDAISDVALAEGVHQAVQGNFDRIGATLNAYSSGNFPPDPDVVQTPPSGIALTHRVAVHFSPSLAAPPNATPKAQAEPALDAWLEGVLPPLDQVGCLVTWTDPASVARQQAVTLADLGLRPIDVLALLKPDSLQQMTELDDRILRFVAATAAPRPDAVLKIDYLTAPAGTVSLFEITALVRSLKTLLAGARPLQATDAMLQNDALPDQNATVFVDRARIAVPKAALDALSADVVAFLGTLGPLVADPVANRDALVNGSDNFVDSAVALLERAARFNIPLSGWGFAFAWRQHAVTDLLAQVQQLVTRWNAKLSDFDARVAAYDLLPAATSDADRFQALRAAELDVATQLDPLPSAPATLRAQLDAKRAAFVAKRDQFAAILSSTGTTFTGFLAAVGALLPISGFDSVPFDLTSFGDRAVALAADLMTNLSGHGSAIDERRAAVQAQLDAHDVAGTAVAQAQALQTAARALLGDDFRIVPEFSLATTQGDEWANAVAASTSGALLSYLNTSLNIDFPVDEWLYGAARVRPMLRAWEKIVMLAGAFGRPEPSLVPVQFPYESAAPWLAMQYPSTYVLDSDRLLYTAQFMTPFDKTARQCGLLLDEWTEVIPATTRNTGITFNFARPDNEPPQAILLITPAAASGTWQWDDLVGAVEETLDLAKKRAVEPSQLDNTPYAPLLPATVMAVTLYAISITTNLAAANGALRFLEAARNA
jgi:hypothetical protein